MAVTRALVVEDSPTQAAAVRAELEAAQFSVVSAEGGLEALRLLETEEFDVVLSDVVMPDLDGYELCRRVKADPRYQDLPVVLLTSLTGPLDVVAALEASADNFIRKPPAPGQLVARLSAAVRNRRQRETGRARMAVQINFLGQLIDITADREQILDLLISTFEELVETSRELRDRETLLAATQDSLEEQVHGLGLENDRLTAVLGSVPVPLFVLSSQGVVTRACQAAAAVFGAATTELVGHRFDDVVGFIDRDGLAIPPEELPHYRAVSQGRACSAGEDMSMFLGTGDGLPVPVQMQARPVWDSRGRPAGCVATVTVWESRAPYNAVTSLPHGPGAH